MNLMGFFVFPASSFLSLINHSPNPIQLIPTISISNLFENYSSSHKSLFIPPPQIPHSPHPKKPFFPYYSFFPYFFSVFRFPFPFPFSVFPFFIFPFSIFPPVAHKVPFHPKSFTILFFISIHPEIKESRGSRNRNRNRKPSLVSF